MNEVSGTLRAPSLRVVGTRRRSRSPQLVFDETSVLGIGDLGQQPDLTRTTTGRTKMTTTSARRNANQTPVTPMYCINRTLNPITRTSPSPTEM